MRFYVEPEYEDNQIDPSRYRLRVAGSGKWYGYLGAILDAELAALIVDLLNADVRQKQGTKGRGG